MTDDDKKISGIYQQADKSEPPAHLDDVILAASREAATPRSRARGPFSGGWPVPAAMAAVLLVTVILVPVVIEETDHENDQPASIVGEQATEPATIEMKARKKLKQQELSTPEKPKAARERILQTAPAYNQASDEQPLEKRLEPEMPAASAPASNTLELDSFSDSAAGFGRIEQQKALEESTQKQKFESFQGLVTKQQIKNTRSAEEWLVDIQELVEADELDKAKTEYKAFKIAYPDYNINPSLIELLE